MKTFALMLALTLSVAYTAHAQKETRPSTKVLDEKFGFRDVPLESDISQHPEMVEVVGEGGSADQKYYRRQSDDLKVGGATLKSITYVYYKGKLEMVLLQTEGAVNSNALLEAYRAQYGYAYHYTAYSPYMWRGKLASLILTINSVSGDGSSLLSSEAIRKQEDIDSKEKAKNAKSDL